MLKQFENKPFYIKVNGKQRKIGHIVSLAVSPDRTGLDVTVKITDEESAGILGAAQDKAEIAASPLGLTNAEIDSIIVQRTRRLQGGLRQRDARPGLSGERLMPTITWSETAVVGRLQPLPAQLLRRSRRLRDDGFIIVTLPPGARADGKEFWEPSVIQAADQALIDGKPITAVTERPKPVLWRDSLGRPVDVENIDKHYALNILHDVRLPQGTERLEHGRLQGRRADAEAA